jgi:hypothetical protein
MNFQKIFSLVKLPLNNRGNLIIFSTVFGVIAMSVVVIAVSGYAISENRASAYKHNAEEAFQIAEAGINYYRWHLAHNSADFQDGTATSGPYAHAYSDKDGNVIGHFSLNVIAPTNSSTVVQVESTGWLDRQPNSRRTIRTRLGFASITDYSILTNSEIWIGDTEVTHGKFHSNNGIRFDGLGDAPITSAVATWTCKSHIGCGTDQVKDGIFGSGGPQEFWSFPVPTKDFDAVTAKLQDIKTGASPQNGGLYLSSSGAYGWRLIFNANGTISVNKVSSLNCYSGRDIGARKHENFCVDIKTVGTPTTTYPIPTSTFIYVEDNVWVQGVVRGRATVGTAAGKSIMIQNSIVYSAKDGSDVLGLVAEQNVIVPHDTPNNMEIDAVMLAQNGAAKRYYYFGDIKEQLIVYGSVISKGVWTWSWVSGGGSITSGYRNTFMNYDDHLTYSPPAGFPVGKTYEVLSWELVN